MYFSFASVVLFFVLFFCCLIVPERRRRHFKNLIKVEKDLEENRQREEELDETGNSHFCSNVLYMIKIKVSRIIPYFIYVHYTGTSHIRTS